MAENIRPTDAPPPPPRPKPPQESSALTMAKARVADMAKHLPAEQLKEKPEQLKEKVVRTVAAGALIVGSFIPQTTNTHEMRKLWDDGQAELVEKKKTRQENEESAANLVEGDRRQEAHGDEIR